MFALATAAHGQSAHLVLVILAVAFAALFWRSLLKIGFAIVIISIFLLIITGAAGIVHLLIP
jgi:hypothetical protein